MRVLLIDDESSVRTVMRRMLERSGYEVVEAATGAEGVNRYLAGDADVVLCDLFMPGMDGLEVICQLREVRARIVAMSGGFANLDLLSSARVLGAAAVLQKPFAMAAVLEAVELAAHAPAELS